MGRGGKAAAALALVCAATATVAVGAVTTNCADRIDLLSRFTVAGPAGAQFASPETSARAQRCEAPVGVLRPGDFAPGANELRVRVEDPVAPESGILRYAGSTRTLSFTFEQEQNGVKVWSSPWHSFDRQAAFEAQEATVEVCWRREGGLQHCTQRPFRR